MCDLHHKHQQFCIFHRVKNAVVTDSHTMDTVAGGELLHARWSWIDCEGVDLPFKAFTQSGVA